MISLSCQTKNLPEQMTVGVVFESYCRGDIPESFKADQATVAEQPDKYALKLLKFEKTTTGEAQLQFTSYRVGQHKFEKVQISDGAITFEIPGFAFQVNSVLPPAEGQQMAEPPKPFGPVGPLIIPVPLSYWLILISVIGITFLLSALSWKRRRDRREVLKEVSKRTTGPTPVVQFHRDLRILTRKAGVQTHGANLNVEPQEYLAELRHIGETFWGQKFNLALLKQSPSSFEREFKSYAPKVYIKYKDELRFWNNRWEKLFSNSKQAQMQDFVDITVATRNLVDKMMDEER